MAINDAAPARSAANFLLLTEREECSYGVHALLRTTPSNLSPPLSSVLFSSQLAHASGVCGPSAAVSLQVEPNM